MIETPPAAQDCQPSRALRLAALLCSLLFVAILQPAAADTADDIQAKLESVRKELAAIEASPGLARNAPAFATPTQLQQRRYYLRETARAFEQQLLDQARIARLAQEVKNAQKQADAWSGHDTPPPYSVLFHDRLVEESEAAAQRLKALNAQLTTLELVSETVDNKLKDSAAAIRAAEASTQAGDPADKWALSLLRLRAQGEEAFRAATKASLDAARLELALAEIGSKLSLRKAADAGGRLVFTEPDYKQVQEALKAQHEALTSGSASLPAPGRLAAPGRRKAQGKEAPHVGGVADDSNLVTAQRYVAALIENKRVIWDLRYRLYNQRTPALIAEAAEKHRQMSKAIDLILPFIEDQLAAAEREVAMLESGGDDASQDARLTEAFRKQLEDARRAQHYLRQVSSYSASTRFQLARIGEELKLGESGLSAWERVQVFARQGERLARIGWNFEVFTVEDTIEVDGRKITGVTSVTVGKITRAVLLFVAGVLVTFWLGRLMEHLAVRRLGFNQARAHILYKWLFALGLAVLVVAVMLWVNIPLSVFAFVGGAAAIAIGFGMQNLLKNLVSGLMLLFEQPFKAGDLVEVGSTKGRITEIGIRSSSLRDENGIETLVPNSVFVEDKVTNWMYSNPQVRFCIKLGVPYGTSGREVKETLEECVGRHGLVLDHPPPEVLLEEFGTDRLKFAVHYWIDIKQQVSSSAIASDLRFMIEKALMEKNIPLGDMATPDDKTARPSSASP